MSAPAQAGLKAVNALDLASKMGVSVEILSHAIGIDPAVLVQNPRGSERDKELGMISELWENLLVLVGDEGRARLFLNQQHPELADQAPIYYLERGKPEVVLNLVFAMREMLP